MSDESKADPKKRGDETDLVDHARLQAGTPAGGRIVPSGKPMIEGYEIVRELHRGGQGIVYQAIQSATRRKVAIKLLLQGMSASKAAKRRFEREVALVAQLRHSNIIAIFDSGSTGDGVPFYAMDYVRGQPLHTYVREHKLTLEETLKLFAKVCEAVQYAHQKGVIHRDLKPSNILVDADGQPRLLDFGLAKQLIEPVDTVVSITQDVVGTLPYMSPEQARGNPEEIDTRTDVYALGVILYELLTGHFPYPVVGQMAEVLRHIAETAPTPPTRKWSSDSGVSRRSSRRVRAGECPIDDEVQVMVLKALSKERERRYQSAGELARDVGHYLAGEPIDAKRDSGWYLIRMAIRRHRVAAAFAITLALVLCVGIIVTTAFWRQAEEQRRRAELAEQEARRLAESEVTLRQEAEWALEGQRKTQVALATTLSAIVATVFATFIPSETGEDVDVSDCTKCGMAREEIWGLEYLAKGDRLRPLDIKSLVQKFTQEGDDPSACDACRATLLEAFGLD